MTSLHIQLYLGCLGADFVMWLCKNWPFWLCWYRVTTRMVAKLAQVTTHNTTHNNQHEPLPPNPPEALPSLTMDRAAVPPNHCAIATYESIAGAQCWVSVCLAPLFWATKQDTSNNSEMGGALTLGGRCLVKKQQQKNSGQKQRKGWWRGSLSPGLQIERRKNYINEICRGLRWPCYNISHATTTQQHVGTMERV
jgi:hypothetical protein